MRAPVIAVAWIATIILAWLLGANFAPKGEERAVSNRTTPAGVPGKVREPIEKATEDSKAPPRTRRAAPAPKLDIAKIETVESLSGAFMKYAAAQLRRGEQGHKELLLQIHALAESGALDRFEDQIDDDKQAARLVYPWIRFLVDHDAQAVDMLETILKNAIENPAFFDGMSDDVVEPFLEVFGWLLPGAVSPERLAQFREYAAAIVARGPDRLPAAIGDRLSNIGDLLDHWSPDLEPQDAIALLSDPKTPQPEKIRAMKALSREELRGFDVAGILAPSIRDGDGRALEFLQEYEATASDLVVLDRAFLEGADHNTWSRWAIEVYLESTGRDDWDKAKSFVLDGLRRGGESVKNFAGALVVLGAPKEFIRDVIANYPLPDELRDELKEHVAGG